MAVDSATGTRPSEKTPLWQDERARALFFQLLLVVGLIGFGYYVYGNVVRNLQNLGIASGFDFLNSTAGFGIITTLVPYSEESSYGRALLVGFLNTVLVSVLGIVLATILGFIIAIMRLSPNWLLSRLATVYIEVIRNLPLLLQIFFWYFAVLRPLPGVRQSVTVGESVFLNNRGLYLPKPVFQPGFEVVVGAVAIAIIAIFALRRWAHKRQDTTGQAFPVFWASLGIFVVLPTLAYLGSGMPVAWEYPELRGFNFAGGLIMIPEFVALLLALSTYTAAFIAEVVRAGILAVSHGQTEASQSLGLRRGQTLHLIVIPQALRVIIPPLTNQYLNLTKNSSLAAAIAYPELVSVFAGTVLNQTGQAIEIIGITMAIYLTLSILISIFMNWYNARIRLVER